MKLDHRDISFAAALFGGLSVLFWLGRARSFGPGDSPEHVVAALTWGVPHPPGYPLQTALAHLWACLPWSDPTAAVNGLSGLFSAAAAAVLFHLLRHQGCRRPAALTAAAFMALAPLYWFYSLVAEVRALNDLLALAAAYAANRWAADGSRRWLFLGACFTGLGLSHHPTFLLVVPALLYWVFTRMPKMRDLLTIIAIALVALIFPYFILGVRLASGEPAYNPYAVNGWADLLNLFLRRNYGGPLRMVSGPGLPGLSDFDLGKLIQHAVRLVSAAMYHAWPAVLCASFAFTIPGAMRREVRGWLIWLGVSVGIFLAISSQQVSVWDPEYERAMATRYYLLPFIAIFAISGHGFEILAARLRPALVNAIATAAFLVPLALRPLWLAHSDPLRDYAKALVRDSGPKDLIILTADDSIFAAYYMDLVTHEAGERVFLVPSMFSYPVYLRLLKARHPDLILPSPVNGKVLSTDWALWKRLNPGRAVLAEAVLRDAILDRWLASVPQVSLIRIEETARKIEPAHDAEAFLNAPETAAFTRLEARTWTQEVFIVQNKRQMAEWVGSRLNPDKDRPLIARLKALLEVL